MNNNYDLTRPNEIVCPICHGDCIFEVNEFKVSLEWSKGHKSSYIYLREFNKTQVINESNVFCGVCKKNHNH